MDFANGEGVLGTNATALETLDWGCVIDRRAAGWTGCPFLVYKAAGSTGRTRYPALAWRHVQFQWFIRPAG